MGSKKHRRPRDLPHNAGGALPSSRHRREFEARRVPGTNGSWPAANVPPSAPPLLMFHDNDHYPGPVKVFGQ